jgi:pimeloyl-ACP methyl ester carboxylesterase
MAAISLPAQIVRTRRFTLGVPGQFTVTPDGASVLFLRSRAGHDPLTRLWTLDLTSGTDPGEFPHAYQACSLLAEAPKLTRPLLLMHGLADDNVFPASTLRLSSALLAAGRPHEVLLLPGVGHHALGTPVTENLLQHQVRFLQRHLGAVPGDW